MGQSLATLKLEVQAEVAAAEANIKRLGKTGQTVTDLLAEDFERLGTRSAMEMEQQRRSAITSYEAIRNSGVASAAEISRAQEALQTRLRGLDAAVEPAKRAIRDLNNEIRQMGRTDPLAASFDALGVRRYRTIRDEIVQIETALNSIRTSGTATFNEIARAEAAAAAKLRDLNGELKNTGAATGNLRDMNRELRGTTSSFDDLTGTLGRAQGLIAGLGVTWIARELYGAAAASETFRNSYESVFETQARTANEMATVRAEAWRLGYEIQNTSKQYLNLSASAKGTNLEGEKTRFIFTAVTSASRALGRSQDDLQGSLTAIGQMISKNTVMAEELKGQLAERLPGAFQIAARAMGVTTAELSKMLEEGKIVADEFLPRFAAELNKTFPLAEKAISGLTAETGRFKTSWLELNQAAMDNGGSWFFTKMIQTARGTLELLRRDVESIATYFSGDTFRDLWNIVKHPLTPHQLSGRDAARIPTQPLNSFDSAVMGLGAPITVDTRSTDSRFYAQPVKPILHPTIDATSRVVKNSALQTEEQQKELEKAGKLYDRALERDRKAHEKHLHDLRRAQEEYHRYTQTLLDAEIARNENARRLELAELDNLRGQDLISEEVWLAKKNDINAAAAQERVDLLKTKLSEAIDAERNALIDLNPDMTGTVDQVAAYHRAINDQVKIRAQLEKAVTDQAVQGIQGQLAEYKIITAEIEKQMQATADLQAMANANAELEASLVGGNSDSIADRYARETAMMKARYQTEFDLIDEKIRRLQKEADAEKKQGKDASLTHDKIAESVKQKELLKQQLTLKSEKLADDSLRSQLAMAGQYTSMAGQMFTALATTQDTTSRQGFESAKAFNIAAAVMSTAAAIMNAMATVPWPMSVAAAALAGVTGAIQIATIASTSFGGGSSGVSIPSGSFAMGGASGAGSTSGIGSMVGNPYQSIREQQTGAQLDAIAEKMGNAALAMGKISESLFEITDYLETGFGKGLVENAPNVALGGYDPKAPTMGQMLSKDFLMPFTGAGVISWVSSFFGSENVVKDVGVSIGFAAGEALVNGWLSREVGSRWSGSKRRYETFEADAQYVEAIDTVVKKMESSAMQMARAIGVSGEQFEQTVQTAVNVQKTDLDRNASDFDEKLANVLTNIQNAMVEAAAPMIKAYALPGGFETATEVLERLSVAITDANIEFKKLGITLFESTPDGANAAYKLTDLMGGAEKFADAMDSYFTNLFTEAEQKVKTTEQAQRDVDRVWMEIESSLPMKWVGVIDNIDNATGTVQTHMEQVAATVPKTREEFRLLVESLDLTKEQGAATFDSLMSISEAFGTMMTAADEAAEKLREVQRGMEDLDVRYLKATGKGAEADELSRQLSAQREIEQAIADNMGDAYINRLREVLRLEELAITNSEADKLIQQREDKRISEAKSLQDQYDQLTMTSDQLLAKQRNSLDESNRSLFDQIENLKKLKTATDQAATAEKQLADQRKSLQDRLDVLTGDRTQRDIDLAKITDDASRSLQQKIWDIEDRKTALDVATNDLKKSFDAEKNKLTAAYNTEIESLNKRLDDSKTIVSELTGYVNKLVSARQRMQLQDAAYQRDQYAAAQAVLAATLVAVRGGDLSMLETMDESLDILSSQSTDAYVNSTDYQRDFWRTKNGIIELEKLAGNQLTDAERALELAQLQIDVLKTHHDDNLIALDNQLNALLGIDNSVQSLSVAMGNYRAAQTAAQTAANRPTPSPMPEKPEPVITTDQQIRDFVAAAWTNYGDTLAARIDIYNKTVEAGVSSHRLAAVTGGDVQGIREWVNAVGLPSFGVGTNYVPYDMVAQIHQGERIIPAADNYRLMQGNDDLVSEVRELRRENRELNVKLERVLSRIADSSDRTARATNGNPDSPVIVEVVNG